MTDQLDTDSIERLRLALARIMRRIDRQVTSDRLTRTQLSVLGSVAVQGPLGLGELAEIENINPTMLSRVVAKLEDGALIRRLVDPQDRRAARVEVTVEGAHLRRQLQERRGQLLTERLVDLPAGTAEQLIAAIPALESLAASLAPTLSNRGAGIAGSASRW